MRAEETMGFTLAQQRALAIVPKFTSSLSITCSMAIIYEVISDHRRGRGTNSVQRVLVGMSVVDIMASSAWFLSTWATPKENGWPYAAGNQASCNYQGFLLQIAIGAPLYNSSLALFYILIIKLRWTDKQIWRLEKWVHALILTFTIGTSFLLLFLEQYNQIGAVCWVIGDPSGCGNSSHRSSDIPCERGNWAWAYGLALFYGPLWICVLACVMSMVLLYKEVKQTVQRASIYTTDYGARPSLGRSGSNSNKVAVQAILYSLTFLITWMPSTLWSIAHWFQWSHFGLDMAAAITEPLQGFWNFLVFLRSRPHTRQRILLYLSMVFPCCCQPPPPLASSAGMASSRYSNGSNNYNNSNNSNNRPVRSEGEESSSRILDPFRSVKQRLKVFLGSIGGSGGAFCFEAHCEDEPKGNSDIPEENGIAAFSTLEDTSSHFREGDSLFDDTSGKSSKQQRPESFLSVDATANENLETPSQHGQPNEEKDLEEEKRQDDGESATKSKNGM